MGADFVPTGVATGVSGSIFAAEVVTAISDSNGTFVPAPGLYYAYAVGADVNLQVQDSTGSWQDVLAAAKGGLICSDGVNVRFINTGSGGDENVTLIKIG